MNRSLDSNEIITIKWANGTILIFYFFIKINKILKFKNKHKIQMILIQGLLRK